ncbi:uncharacterized protein FPRO_06368 [Fusarium proliferatum ET1]|uniref:Uncharacterized protein n=1 Tax=Fusarium proliferatum (strain ET1) TaxID=1227346 RepID=A0A1L7VCN6_FUSPR|nr:uncharacterized protein FPRO_06368 [Fusarium proliferatum ET1]CZR38441.1 uncharacterized protein FPRO_06368 [Fusarium proliferatum ET1]
MDQTSKKSKEFQTRMGQRKKIKDQTNLEQQLQTDQVEEPSPKNHATRARPSNNRATGPDQFKRDELDLAKVDKHGDQRYRKTVVTLSDCE